MFYPCGPGSHDEIVCPCGPGSDEVDVYPCGPGLDEVDVRTSSFEEINRPRFVILMNKNENEKIVSVHLVVLQVLENVSFLKSSSNSFSYVHLRYSVRSKSNPNFCWLEF